MAGLAEDQHATILWVEPVGELAVLDAVLTVRVHIVVLVVELGVIVPKAIQASE